MLGVLDLPFKFHATLAFIIRLAFVCYGTYHDSHFDVPYTDIDYKVFTDAAKHVYQGDSPYKRHTYRYSPIIAILLTPNVFLNSNFGKILFCVFDIFCSYAIKQLIEKQLGSKSTTATKIAIHCSLFWLYNPMSIAISTRGNADSMPCFIIIISLLFLQTDLVLGNLKYFLSGMFLGLSIHLRLYPIAFTFPMYLSLGEYKITNKTNIKDGIIQLLPNKKQLILASSCVLSFVTITGGMYLLYGYEFLFETYIYHLFRKDTRHNFSVLFYYSYLTSGQTIDLIKMLTQIFECVILFILSLAFGTNSKTLAFCLFSQSMVLVAYNSVMTSQYFIWFLSLLPLVVHDFNMKPNLAIMLGIIWMFPQAKWLYFAYLLEFKGQDTFVFIWLSGILFFFANIYVLGQLIKYYKPNYGFGQIVNMSEIKNK